MTRAVLRLVWHSILLQSARRRVATTAKPVAASRLWCAVHVKQRKQNLKRLIFLIGSLGHHQHLTHMHSFIISHTSCAEQFGDMSSETQTHSHTHSHTNKPPPAGVQLVGYTSTNISIFSPLQPRAFVSIYKHSNQFNIEFTSSPSMSLLFQYSLSFWHALLVLVSFLHGISHETTPSKWSSRGVLFLCPSLPDDMVYHTSMTILNETAAIRVKQDFMDLVTDELSKLESNILDFSDLIQHNKELSRFDFWTSLFFSATVFTTVGMWAVVAIM